MPPTGEPLSKSLQDVVDDLGLYPADAFHFVQEGLSYTVERIHGATPGAAGMEINRHVSGQDLCVGLRDLALSHWGMMAGTVLRRWGITSTLDFGRIVFALVQSGFLQTTDGDSLEDFRNVYDFRSTFEVGYRIELQTGRTK